MERKNNSEPESIEETKKGEKNKQPKKKNGQGSFQELRDGRIRMYLQVGILQNGRPKRLTVIGTSETDCVKKMKKKELQFYANGGVLPSVSNNQIETMTLEELCLKHLAWDMSIPNKLKASSIDRRELTIKNHIGRFPIGRLQVTRVTSNDVFQHIQKLLNTPSKKRKTENQSVSNVEKVYNVINAAFKWAMPTYCITFNPCASIHDTMTELFGTLKDRTEPKEQVITLSEDDMDAIKREVAKKKGKPLANLLFDQSVLLLTETGIRVGELCALRLSDYIPQIGILSVTKTRERIKDRSNSPKKTTLIETSTKNDKTRNILLTNEAVNILEQMKTLLTEFKSKKGTVLTKNDYIFVNRNNKPTCPSDYDARLRRFFTSAGLDIEVISGSHVFRRTNATEFHRAGGSAEEIAAYIGDAIPTVQEYYISKTVKMESDGKTYDVVPRPARRKKEETQSENK